MTTSATTSLWLAYGADDHVVGSIRKSQDGYIVTMTDAAAALGTYPTMEIAKSALHGHMTPGADWPRFREH